MIEAIDISNVASYSGLVQTLSDLKKINYIYGANGSGKTTISRLIADCKKHSSCKLTWKSDIPLETMVYNRDFVEANFSSSTSLKGVFTLGEDLVETQNKIIEAEIKHEELIKEINKSNKTLEGVDGTAGKKHELLQLKNELSEKCWVQKQRYDGKFNKAFTRVRGSKESFKDRVLKEQELNKESLLSQMELERKCASVFEETPIKEQIIGRLDLGELIKTEDNPILKKSVIGKEDVEIAAMIKALGNSDWVQQGRGYLERNGSVCPFCQQHIEASFAQSLEEYFDESFLRDSKTIKLLVDTYEEDAKRLQERIAAIIEMPSRFLDVENLKQKSQLLDSAITLNLQKLAKKKNEASQTVELESLAIVISEIKGLIASADEKTQEHNVAIANLTVEQNKLTSQVWKFILEELKADLASFNKNSSGLIKAIESLTKAIDKTKADMKQNDEEIRALEKQITSVQPTVNAINELLISFGLNSFSLEAADKSSYKLIRSDGTDVKDTLSEGEKTFVTFLYFYHLLKGSQSEDGTRKDRVVVIDDPVSSLDSDILFLVSSLIKKLFSEIREDKGHIKQVFVLTHNVYFHKEVTYNSKRKSKALNDETFWVVRKANALSEIMQHDTNPVTTSYDLLWAEVRRTDPSILSIQNTLRRILENYFKILGNVDPDNLCNKFNGNQKQICKSLFSWVNDGSHFAHDDLCFTLGSETVETYLNVFREIFNMSGHLAHYEMMMGDAFVEKDSQTASQ